MNPIEWDNERTLNPNDWRNADEFDLRSAEPKGLRP